MGPIGKVVSVRGATITGETLAAESFSVGSFVSVSMHDYRIIGVVTSLEMGEGDVVKFSANLF